MNVAVLVRDIIEATTEVGDSAGIGDTDNLFEAGLTSLDLVSLVLGLEQAFNIEIPDQRLVRDTFESIDSITRMIRESVSSR